MDNPIKLGDVWYRVDGQYVDHGNEIYEGMELVWTTWTAVKITPPVEHGLSAMNFLLRDDSR